MAERLRNHRPTPSLEAEEAYELLATLRAESKLGRVNPNY